MIPLGSQPKETIPKELCDLFWTPVVWYKTGYYQDGETFQQGYYVVTKGVWYATHFVAYGFGTKPVKLGDVYMPQLAAETAINSLIQMTAVKLEEANTKAHQTRVGLKEGDTVTLCLQFKIQQKIGEGGFGVVWKAVDESSNLEVAIKEQNKGGVPRFQSETSAHISISQLPRVPKFIAKKSEVGSYPLSVMEFIPGETAQTYFGRHSMSQQAAIKFLLLCLESLELIHRRGFLHRDVTPKNIIMHQNTLEPWIVDFGIAKDIRLGIQKITDAGTSPFRPPEDKLHVGHYTDIYGLGATVLSLTQKLSTEDMNWHEVVPRCDDFSDQFKAILSTMVHPKYKLRYQTCGEVIQALRRLNPFFRSTETSDDQDHPCTPPRSPLHQQLEQFRSTDDDRTSLWEQD